MSIQLTSTIIILNLRIKGARLLAKSRKTQQPISEDANLKVTCLGEGGVSASGETENLPVKRRKKGKLIFS